MSPIRSLRLSRRAMTALSMLGFGSLLAVLLIMRSAGSPAGPPATPSAEVGADRPTASPPALSQAALDASERRIRELEAMQARTQAAAEASAATAAGEIARLRGQVKEAEASAATAQEATDRATRRIRALTECLNGTTVALQFGRTDAWDPADRALAAVAAACADAKALR